MSSEKSPTPPKRFWDRELDEIKSKGLMRRLREVSSATSSEIIVDGKPVIGLCSNDYLGLAACPEIAEAAIFAIEKYGYGAGASRLISGTVTPHLELERAIADFKGAEAALSFSSGYAANCGVIPALAGAGDVIFTDSLNHASIIDGCRLSKAEKVIFAHNNMEELDKLLRRKTGRRRWIITEALFSMDGDYVDLETLVELAERYEAHIYLDEAHSTGCIGPRGAGLAAEKGLGGAIAVQMGTLGKAIGASGAYIAADRGLVDLLINRARSFVFSTAPPPSVAEAARVGLRLAADGEKKRQKLKKNCILIKEGLARAGFGEVFGESQIIPLIIGRADQAMAAASFLLEAGVYVQGIRPPTVAEGSSRLRITVTSELSEEQIDKILCAFGRLGEKLRSADNQAGYQA